MIVRRAVFTADFAKLSEHLPKNRMLRRSLVFVHAAVNKRLTCIYWKSAYQQIALRGQQLYNPVH